MRGKNFYRILSAVNIFLLVFQLLSPVLFSGFNRIIYAEDAPTGTPTGSISASPSPSTNPSPGDTAKISPTPEVTPPETTPAPELTPAPQLSLTPTPTDTIIYTPSPDPSLTPLPTENLTPTPTPGPSISPEPTPTLSPEPTPKQEGLGQAPVSTGGATLGDVLGTSGVLRGKSNKNSGGNNNFTILLGGGPGGGGGPLSVDPLQCANGGIGNAPESCSGGNWVKGDVNKQKAHWNEADFLSYRVVINNVESGSGSYTFSYDVTKGGKHAIDYLGNYDYTETTGSPNSLHANENNPCGDVSGMSVACTPSTPTSQVSVTNDDTLTSFPVACGSNTFIDSQIAGSIKAWGLNLTHFTYESQNVGSSDCTTTVRVDWDATSHTSGTSNVVIAFGGHIASQSDWQIGNSAINIDGSPYHIHQVSLTVNGVDKNVGSQDLQLAASAIIPPSTITIHKTTDPAGGSGFGFTTNGLTPTGFNLDDSGTRTFLSVSPGVYTVTENSPVTYSLTGLTCNVSGNDTEALTDLNSRTATITIGGGGGGIVDCYYTNTRQSGTIELKKVWVGTGSQTTLNIGTTAGGSEVFSQQTGSGGGNPLTTDAKKVNTGTYYVSETGGLTGYNSALDCTKNGNIYSPGLLNAVEIGSGDAVVCTFTNSLQNGHLVVQKNTYPPGDPTIFTINADGNGTIVGGGAGTVTDAADKSYEVTPGIYSVAETVPTGWSKTGDTCQNVDVGPGETKYCLLTNVKPDARISLSPLTATNAVGSQHQITATVLADSGSGLIDAPDGTPVVFSFSQNNIGATFVGDIDTCNTVGGTCSVKINSLASGTVTVHAATDVTILGIILHRETSGTDNNNIDAGKTYVEARLAISGTATNEVGTPHIFTVTAVKNDGSGWTGISGVYPVVTFAPTSPGTVTDNCNLAGTNASGQCTVIINSETAGIFTAHAAVSATVNGVNFDLETDGNGLNSGEAVKTYVDAKINLSQLKATNNINEPHTITASVEENPGSGFIAAEGELVTFSLLNNTAGAVFTGGNTCTTDAGGVCTVQINSATPGSVDIHAVVDDHVGGLVLTRATDGTHGSSGDANKIYQGGNIIIEKQTLPDGGASQSFTFDPSWSVKNFNLTDGAQENSGWLAPGTYTVTESGLTGWDLTAINCTGAGDWSAVLNGGIVTVDLQPGESATCTFTNTERGSISGYKYNDLNGDGGFDTGEPKLPGWTIHLFDSGWNEVTQMPTDLNGNYKFEDVVPGSYFICEDPTPAGWIQTDPSNTVEWNGTHCQTATVYAGADLTDKIFGNFEKVSLTACKLVDSDGSLTTTNDQTVKPGWPVNLLVNGKVNDSQFTGAEGCYTWSGLGPESYGVAESPVTDWHNLTPPNYDFGQVESGHDYSYTFINARDTGTVIVHKKVDINGDGQYEGGDSSANQIGFRWSLDNEDPTLASREMGSPETVTTIDNHTVNENSVASYQFTGWYLGGEGDCREIPEDQKTLPISFSLGSNGEQRVITLCNQALNPILTITKINDTGGADKHPTEIVLFTLTVTATQSGVKNVHLYDLPAGGFSYKSGSCTATSSVRGVLPCNPGYHSPGEWDLGDMAKDETVTLTYQTDIAGDITLGLYKDLAWAVGQTLGGSPVYAQAINPGYWDTNYVGTTVNVIGERQNNTSVNIENIQEGQVLGASLPSTGVELARVIGALFIFLSGLALFIFGIVLRRRWAGRAIKKVVTLTIIGILTSLTLSGKVYAADLTLRISEPKSPVNTNTFDVNFVALDLQNRAINITCYKKAPSDAAFYVFETFALPAGGATGDCAVDSGVVSAQGTYSFYVTAQAGADPAITSPTVSVNYLTDGPGTPTNFGRSQVALCQNKITFTTADDGGKTVKVEIYRSTATSFNVDDTTRVGSVGIGSATNGSFLDTIPGACDQTYFYVIRAFDAAGNGSGIIGDSYTKTVYVTVSPTPGAALAAIPVAAGAGQVGGGTEETASEAGKVLGKEEVASEGGKAPSGLSRFTDRVLPWLSLVAILGIGVYFFYLRRRRS